MIFFSFLFFTKNRNLHILFFIFFFHFFFGGGRVGWGCGGGGMEGVGWQGGSVARVSEFFLQIIQI